MTKISPARTRPREARTPTRVTERRMAIPQPLQFVRENASDGTRQTIRQPTLILRGEWLKAAGFPIGAGCYIELDRRGQLAVHRLGLGVPRRLRIVAK